MQDKGNGRLPRNNHFEVVLIPQGLWQMPGGGKSDYDCDRYHLVPVSREARIWLLAIDERRCSADHSLCYPGPIHRFEGAVQELAMRTSDGSFIVREFDLQTQECIKDRRGDALEDALEKLTLGLTRVMKENLALFMDVTQK